jgi:RND family efflux transporter MFP subunit
MKNLFNLLLLSLITLSACGSDSDLAALKADKAEIETQLKTLKTELAVLDDAIAELDTTARSENLELVTTIEINNGEFNNYIEAQGKTYTEDNVMVTTDMGGLVTRVFVDEGQYVSKGKVLFQLDNSIILNQLAELETGISLAKDIFIKRQNLWNQNIGSEIEFLQAKNNYESLLNKKSTLNTQLSKASIKAPITGYINSISVKLGEMASPGMPACQIVNNKDMEVHIDLPEIYLGKAKKGDQLLVEIAALNINRTAKVTSVGQTVNQYNRSFQIIASIDNSKNDIKANMLAKVKFTSESVKESITIPTSLLQESSDGYFVFVAEKDSAKNEVVAHKKQIEIGDSYGGVILVLSGLELGQLLIDKGFRNVLDGQFIKIKE